MHIAEGALSGTAAGAAVLAGGWAIAVGGTALALYRLEHDRLPRVALLTAAFYVASLVQLPLGGPVSVHLVLNGLLGVMLGWEAFPAIFIGLVLQAVFFQFGGLTTLGVNTANMALPAVACHYLFRRPIRHGGPIAVAVAGFLAGFAAIVLAALCVAAALSAGGKGYDKLVWVTLASELPLAPVEGLIAAAMVGYLRKVRPELLMPPDRVEHWPEVSHEA